MPYIWLVSDNATLMMGFGRPASIRSATVCNTMCVETHLESDGSLFSVVVSLFPHTAFGTLELECEHIHKYSLKEVGRHLPLTNIHYWLRLFLAWIVVEMLALLTASQVLMIDKLTSKGCVMIQNQWIPMSPISSLHRASQAPLT